ncbi:DUF2378 family protein [Pyxidicoccus fallax]|uniref:DUF2378 family protein n=1 Tax=Pyxidicoccus fallax TaxID=394095 RepID=A0A848LYX2_9BACT|nr:DUF2378 family protein [Pyxidicoccus fallax]NMO22800.1 DUF2378 family protein [Pyxidicoccus fallax]NPC84972.1 DUF2378 family protein [Pyxidicoccus fallax]
MRALGEQVRAEPVPQRRLIFEHTVSWLLQPAVRLRLSPTAYAALKEVGLDVTERLRPAYSFDTWRRSLAIIAADLYPTTPLDESYRLLGRALVRGVELTTMGRAMVSMARLLGPLRSLRRMNETFRSADNYVESRFTQCGPTHCELWINEVMDRPGYYQGVLEAGLELVGARDARVEVLSRDGDGATYSVSWRAK